LVAARNNNTHTIHNDIPNVKRVSFFNNNPDLMNTDH
jgi:hypothetical protein